MTHPSAQPWLHNPAYGGMSAEAARRSWEAERQRSALNGSRIHRASDLRHKQFPPIAYVVPGFIAEGCTLLAGRPKLGKSWLMLEIALAVSAGAKALGASCPQGNVLYLALEDNERRLQSRITKLHGYAQTWPASLHYATEWPRAEAGGLEEIRRWIKSVDKPRLIVVDVLAMFRSPAGPKDSPYEVDYRAIQCLQTVASEFNIAIVIVHHLRKSGAEVDPFEKVSGTMGLSGGADSVLVLDRDGQGTTLYGRGRDIEEIDTAVEFVRETCRWRVLGKAADVRRTDERSQILSLLIDASEPLTPKEISLGTGMDRNNIDQLLFKTARAIPPEVQKVSRGRYIHAERCDLNGEAPPPRKDDTKVREPEYPQS